MRSFEDIVERLKDIISQQVGQKKVFDKDVAGVLGIEPVNFATMKKRDKIPFRELSEFCAKRKVSLNWLLFDQSPETLIDATSKYYEVKYLREINASAGGGAENYNEIQDSIAVPQSFIVAIGGEKNLSNIEAINVVGDSMEPTLPDRAVVFIDKSKTNPKKGGVFAVTSTTGVFIKRINQKINGEIELISDNKDYSSITLSQNDLVIIGRAVAAFGLVF